MLQQQASFSNPQVIEVARREQLWAAVKQLGPQIENKYDPPWLRVFLAAPVIGCVGFR